MTSNESRNINGKQIIGIDHGYGNLKTRNMTIKSGIKEVTIEPLVSQEVLKVGNRMFLVGDKHKGFLRDKTEDDDFYNLTLYAIGSELKARGLTEAEVILAVGLPLNWYTTDRERFKKYLLKESILDFSINKTTYHVKICDVSVYPQGYAAVATEYAKYNGIHMLADIGNGTMNTMTFMYGKIKGDMYTDICGVQQCLDRIYHAVQDECHKKLHDDFIENFIKTGNIDFPESTCKENISKVMRREVEQYVKEIYSKLTEYNYDPDLVKLHIVGGGGCLIRNFDQGLFETADIISDIRASAKGYEEMYYAQYMRRKNG